MASNTNKRIPIKWIRDRAKSAYQKQDACHICGGTAELELHHTHSITVLLEKWVTVKGYDISSDEKILAVRDEFIKDHYSEIYNEVYTLCNRHHVMLHRVFGSTPLPITAEKQGRWIEKQKAKLLGVELPEEENKVTTIKSGAFSKFY